MRAPRRAIRRIARPIVAPVARFLEIEAAGGILLVVATVVALVWANSPWGDAYESFWTFVVSFDVGGYEFAEDLRHLVNDALMALFFLVVGAEIKRELVTGELRDRRAVGLPVMAAFGGMVVPAAIYLAFNAGGAGADGWGIPMATDIAFATAVVLALGSRVPSSVKVLLLSLAIVDDIGAIAVIAVFYTDDLDVRMLAAAVAIVVVIALVHRAGCAHPVVLVATGVALWFVVFESGVHATIAGVIIGVLLPAERDARADDDPATHDESPCDRTIEALHPWTSYLIVPVFALANAGLVLSASTFRDPSDVVVGVAVALVVGKFVGVTAFSWLAIRLGIGRLPDDASWRHVAGVGAVAGIGFTVSLFIAGLAFDDLALQDEAKAGIFVASIVAAIGGVLLLRGAGRSSAEIGEGPSSGVQAAHPVDP